MFHNIRILSEKHRVRVISFVESEEEFELLGSLYDICDSVKAIRRLPSLRPQYFSLNPFLAWAFDTPEMHRAIEMEFEKCNFDVLQCEYLSMGQYFRKGVFNVLTMHEAVSANAWAAVKRSVNPVDKLREFYRWMAILRYEAMMCRKFDRVITMTEDDAAYLRAYSPSANIHAIPIGVDTNEFTPSVEDSERPPDIVFVGNFRHRPNIEAAEFLVEQVAPHFLRCQIVIAGAQPPESLRGVRGNVIFPGYVPDLRTLYRRPNTIVAAPVFSGTGQRVKLLEAFAMGCPVITTSVGARGFPIKDGTHALIANTSDEYVAGVTRLSGCPELRRQLGMNARQMIEQHFSWDHIGPQLLEAIGS